MAITDFRGEYRWLSNFWMVPIILPDDGKVYPSTEHAYQAAKTLDEAEREMIRLAPKCRDARDLGQKVKLRDNWIGLKNVVMLDCLRQKFAYPDLAQKLLDTGDHTLVEGNSWGDTWFGVCNGVGENYLGKLLMQVRQEIREQREKNKVVIPNCF